MVSARSFFAGTMIVLAVFAKFGQSLTPEETKIVRHVTATQKVVALTFDDGPNPKTTPEILKILKEKNVKATFFILGENAAAHPALVRQTAAEGHEIATHAYSHRHLKNLSREDCAEELDRTEAALFEAAAVKPQLFRPPGGLYNDDVLEEAAKRGYTTVLWSVDPEDWKRPSADAVVRTVAKGASSGGIVLLHDGMYPLPTPKAVAKIIERLAAEGYRFVTVGELLRLTQA